VQQWRSLSGLTARTRTAELQDYTRRPGSADPAPSRLGLFRLAYAGGRPAKPVSARCGAGMQPRTERDRAAPVAPQGPARHASRPRRPNRPAGRPHGRGSACPGTLPATRRGRRPPGTPRPPALRTPRRDGAPHPACPGARSRVVSVRLNRSQTLLILVSDDVPAHWRGSSGDAASSSPRSVESPARIDPLASSGDCANSGRPGGGLRSTASGRIR
jgi:hypothetical protein